MESDPRGTQDRRAHTNQKEIAGAIFRGCIVATETFPEPDAVAPVPCSENLQLSSKLSIKPREIPNCIGGDYSEESGNSRGNSKTIPVIKTKVEHKVEESEAHNIKDSNYTQPAVSEFGA